MHAAKKIQRLLDEGKDPEQVAILVDLACALGKGGAFDLSALYTIDMAYFKLGMDLLGEWRLGQHISARGKVLEQLQAAGKQKKKIARNGGEVGGPA
ncbi:hypothetical protein [Paludibacterium yongneupense]|uniref:hypothetical protein n=1 Tax=Paludibacterium yongneupense TaxID=400061 RepID=UPI000404EA00|nr:hypothetical protein [Paludibacterium yongneupense]